MTYTIRIFWDEVDKVYFAEAVDLKGCIHHGRSYQEALERLLKIIPIWLKEARGIDDTTQ